MLAKPLWPETKASKGLVCCGVVLTPQPATPAGASSRGHFAAHLRASFYNSGKLDAAILGENWLTPNNGSTSNNTPHQQQQQQPQLQSTAGCNSKGHWREAVTAGPGSGSSVQQQQAPVSLATVEAAGGSTGSSSSRAGGGGCARRFTRAHAWSYVDQVIASSCWFRFHRLIWPIQQAWGVVPSLQSQPAE
jgi:hypothetical protein